MPVAIANHLRPRREKIFGPAPEHQLDGNAKAAVSEPIYVYRSAMDTLYPTASGSLPTTVLSLAASDPEVREENEALTWPRIYDIIEFLGGPSSIAKSGFASKKKTGCVKQTANYYRHLGNPRVSLSG